MTCKIRLYKPLLPVLSSFFPQLPETLHQPLLRSSFIMQRECKYLFTVREEHEFKDTPLKELQDDLSCLLTTRWGGFMVNCPTSPESIIWENPKFMVGREKMDHALGNLGSAFTITLMASGSTIDEVLKFQSLKTKYDIPDCLPENSEMPQSTSGPWKRKRV